jgi:hypothetical protein
MRRPKGVPMMISIREQGSIATLLGRALGPVRHGI